MAINYNDLAPYAVGNAALGGPSSIAGVTDEMSRRVAAMVAAMPPEIRSRFQITSGFRNAARQAQVNPGVTNSRHMHGMALDLGNDPAVLSWINQHGQEHGLGFPLKSMPHEQNHLEMVDSLGNRLGVNGPAGPLSATVTPTPTDNSGAGAGDYGGGGDEIGSPANAAALSGPGPDYWRAMAELQLQSGGGGLGNMFARAFQSSQTPASAPQPILQPINPGAPIPLTQRIG